MLKSKQKLKKQILSKETGKAESKKIKTASSSGSGFYYSFMTVILIICLIQILISAVLNISKIISYQAKIVQITNTRDVANALNEQLKDNIKNFSNVSGLEEIARNNLKMSGEDEVLVIINTKQEEENEEIKQKNKFLKFFEHKKEK